MVWRGGSRLRAERPSAGTDEARGAGARTRGAVFASLRLCVFAIFGLRGHISQRRKDAKTQRRKDAKTQRRGRRRSPRASARDVRGGTPKAPSSFEGPRF